MCMTQDPTIGMPAVINGKPVISKQDVRAAISSFTTASATDSVTTLEVKNKLRADNKYATQDMVSYFMDQVYQESQGTPDELSRSSNGSYFTYTVNSGSANAAAALLAGLPRKQAYNPTPATPLSGTASFSTLIGGLMGGNPTQALQNLQSSTNASVVASKASPAANPFQSTPILVNPSSAELKSANNQSWFAYDKDNQLKSSLYDESLTRDQVRASHARQTGIDRDDARACRLANLSGY